MILMPRATYTKATSADGTGQVLASLPGNNLGHLLLHQGLLYVVNRGNHQLYTVNPETGDTELLAGTGARGNANGLALEATLSLPNDIAFSPDGTKIYFNDVSTSAQGNEISPVVIRVLHLAH